MVSLQLVLILCNKCQGIGTLQGGCVKGDDYIGFQGGYDIQQ